MFKHNRHKGIGIGGFSCSCCNDNIGNKKAGRRKVRSLNKKTTRMIIKESI